MGLFDNDYGRLADLLRGKIVRAPDGRRFTVTEAEGYARRENEAPLYWPIVDMEPGALFCPRRRNAILPLIACLDGGDRGGCVLVRGLRSATDGMFSGPSAVSAALGITEPRTIGVLVELPAGDLRLELHSLGTTKRDHPRPPRERVVTKATLNQATVQVLMPVIAQRWRAGGRQQPFQDYLRGLIEVNQTPSALRRALGLK